MKRLLGILTAVMLLALAFAFVPKVTTVSAFGENEQLPDGFLDRIGSLFQPSQELVGEKVYVGGYPLGLTIDGDGVTVTGLNEFVDESGELCCPALKSGLAINDVVVELDGKRIYSSVKLSEIASRSQGKTVTIKYVRGGQCLTGEITPVKDVSAGRYRLGLWTRDSSSGIGTLTYVRQNLDFGSLGHPICDLHGNIVKCNRGGVFSCEINGVKKGVKGEAGELKGAFGFDNKIGVLSDNNKFGAFGSFNSLPSFCTDLVDVALPSEVVPGKATILSTVDGERKEYQVEIVKAVGQGFPSDKGMVIHVTDDELIEKTGGIVQGMSGSPILQNGKLVGAVTHVFINDPTRGYGIFAEWMLRAGNF